MNRIDPFFQTTKPHTRPFLESLHRTYGEPKGALPRRDEEAFARALAFRKQEKQKYNALESERQLTLAKGAGECARTAGVDESRGRQDQAALGTTFQASIRWSGSRPSRSAKVSGAGRLHAHIWLTVHHYSQVQINMPVMQMMFHYNNQCQQLGIASMMQRGMPYIQVKLLPYRYIPGI